MSESTYFNWQSKLSALVPDNMKIGDDFYILEHLQVEDSFNDPRKVDASTFILLEEGCSRAVVDGVEYGIQAPCIAVIMPNQTYHLIEASEDLSFKAVVMSRRFTDSLFGAYAGANNLYSMIREYPVIDISSDIRSFNTYFKALLGAVRSPFKMFRLESAKHLTLSMLYFYAKKLENVQKSAIKKDILYERFCGDARLHYREFRSLPFYAGRLGISTKYLTDLVKEKSGQTAAEYIDGLTLTESKALLSSTPYPIHQISLMLHFPSPSVFGKFFKRMTGVTPTEYREGAR